MSLHWKRQAAGPAIEPFPVPALAQRAEPSTARRILEVSESSPPSPEGCCWLPVPVPQKCRRDGRPTREPPRASLRRSMPAPFVLQSFRIPDRHECWQFSTSLGRLRLHTTQLWRCSWQQSAPLLPWDMQTPARTCRPDRTRPAARVEFRRPTPNSATRCRPSVPADSWEWQGWSPVVASHPH